MSTTSPHEPTYFPAADNLGCLVIDKTQGPQFFFEGIISHPGHHFDDAIHIVSEA